MFLDKFKDSPKGKYIIIMIIIGLVIVLLTYLLIFIPTEAAVPTYGILDYEFAWTPDRVAKILLAWGPEGRFRQTLAIYWDFLFIVGYSSLALGLILLILRKSDEKVQTIGLYFTLTPFLTGIFDIIENINLLIMLDSSIISPIVSNTNSFLASFSALIKFGLLFAAITYFIVALIIIIIKRFKKA
ncbi:MAG: hypothetical protein ACFFBV_09745 [Promethearchaeota archaeon]